MEGEKAVLLCRSLRFRGAHIYYATGATGNKLIGVAAIIKYRMSTGVIRQETISRTSICSMLNT